MSKLCITLGKPNIVIHCEEAIVAAEIQYKSPLLKEFIEVCADKFPQWEFRCCYFVGSSHIRVIDVFEDGEPLGEIGLWHGATGWKLEFKNERITRLSQRGVKRTKHTDEGLKILMRFFGLLTIPEMTEQATRDCASTVRAVAHASDREFTNARNHLFTYLWDYIHQNVKELIPIAVSAGADINEIKDIESLCEDKDITGGVYSCFAEKKGTVVLLHGPRYIALAQRDGIPQTFTEESAPGLLKQKLGFLKLVEDGQCITNVGIRTSQNVFFIMGDLV